MFRRQRPDEETWRAEERARPATARVLRLPPRTGTRDCVYSGKFLQYIIAREAEGEPPRGYNFVAVVPACRYALALPLYPLELYGGALAVPRSQVGKAAPAGIKSNRWSYYRLYSTVQYVDFLLSTF